MAEDLQNLYLYQLAAALKNITASTSYLSSPKISLVLYQTQKSDKPMTIAFALAKRLQLVDFIVFRVVNNKPPAVVFYHDFVSEKTQTRNIGSELFPESLKSMNGYKLRVGVQKERWPKHYKQNFGVSTHLEPLPRLFKVYEHFASFMNVTSIFVPVSGNQLNSFLQESKIDMKLNAYDVAEDPSVLQYGYLLGFDQYSALVPMIKEEKAVVSINNFYWLIAFIGLVLASYLTLKY